MLLNNIEITLGNEESASNLDPFAGILNSHMCKSEIIWHLHQYFIIRKFICLKLIFVNP